MQQLVAPDSLSGEDQMAETGHLARCLPQPDTGWGFNPRPTSAGPVAEMESESPAAR